MLYRSGSWLFCTLVAVVAAGSIAEDSTPGYDSEVTVHHIRIENLDSSTAESVEEARPDRAADLGALLDHGYGSMVALVAGDTRLVAHRAVLAARSPVLRRLLQDIAVGEVAVPDVEGPVLRQLAAYLYTLQAPQLPAMAPQLLAAADQYGLPALKADCERQVAARLSVETAAAAAVVAVRHSSDSLRKAAVAYIRAHISQVVATQGWAEAIHSQPRAMTEVARLLSESPAETSSPASAASRTAPSTEPQSVHSSRGQTPAPAASPTTSDSSVSSGSTNICLLCSSAPAECGSSPYHATQTHSDYGVHQTPTAAAPTMVAETITHPDGDNISRLRSSAPEESGSSPFHATQTHSDYVVHQTPTTAAPTMVAQTITHPDGDHISRLRSSAPAQSGSSPYHATQPHSDYSVHQTPATAAATMVAETITHPDDDHISRLRQLSAEEKNRRLREAAKQGAVWELEALLAAGADVAGRGEDMLTALHWAARKGHEEAASRLLAAGADVAARDGAMWTALHFAAREGHEEAARRLLAAGAAVDARDIGQQTPLHYAADWGHAAVVRLLLAAGADHGARDVSGSTPLHEAATWGHTEAAAALLEGGADRATSDVWGETPLDTARRMNRQQVVALLQGR